MSYAKSTSISDQDATLRSCVKYGAAADTRSVSPRPWRGQAAYGGAAGAVLHTRSFRCVLSGHACTILITHNS